MDRSGSPSQVAVSLMVDAQDSELLSAASGAASLLGCTVVQHDFQDEDAALDPAILLCVVQVEDAAVLRPISTRPSTQPPTIALVGPADGLALEAIRQGAREVAPWPTSAAHLNKIVADSRAIGRQRAEDRHLLCDYARRSLTLTPAEREVLERVVQGKLNKQIASEMDVSIRTIEQRRRRVFAKMDVESAVPLARRVAQIETLRRLYFIEPRRIDARVLG